MIAKFYYNTNLINEDAKEELLFTFSCEWKCGSYFSSELLSASDKNGNDLKDKIEDIDVVRRIARSIYDAVYDN